MAITGTPTIRSLEDKSGRRLKPQDGVYTASLIETGDADKAEIQFNDGTTLRLNFNTTLEIPATQQPNNQTTQQPNSRPTEVKLLLGAIWTKVAKLGPENKFEVNTPVATAAVRGTEFGLRVQLVANRGTIEDRRSRKNQQSSIFHPRSSELEAVLTVHEGKVEFFNDRGKVEATENMESVATTNSAPTEPKRLASLRLFQTATTLKITATTSRLELPDAVERLVFDAGWAGIGVRDVIPETLEQVLAREWWKPPVMAEQVRVVRVMRNSPAERAGLQVGDVITQLNGKPVDKAAEVNAAIFAHPKALVSLTVSRADSQSPQLVITLTTTRPFDGPSLPSLSRNTDRGLRDATWLLIVGKTDEAERELLRLRSLTRVVNLDQAAVENNLGVLYEMKDEMGQAIRHYALATQRDPHAALYHFNLGMALEKVGNLDRFIEEEEMAVQLSPRWVKARLILVRAYDLRNRLDEATQMIEATLKINPKAPEVWQQKIWLLRRQLRVDDAMQAAHHAVELEPLWAEVYDWLCGVYFDRDNQTEEAKCCRKSIELDPGDSEAYYSLSIHNKNSIHRERLCRKAIALSPNEAVMYGQLAFYYVERGGHANEAEAAEVEKLIRKQVELGGKPDFLTLYSFYSRRGQLDKAEEMLHKASENLTPDHFRPFVGLGDVYRERGQLDDAVRMYRKAIEINPVPNWMDAYGKLNQLYIQKNQPEEAEKLYLKLLELDPNNASAYVFLATFYLMQGKTVQAEKAIQGAWKEIERSPSPDLRLGVTLREWGQFDKAETIFRKCMEVDPTNPWVYHNLAIIYETRGQMVEAEEMYRRAIEDLHHNNVYAYRDAANVYLTLRKFDEAERMIRKAIEVAPDSSPAYRVLGLICRNQGRVREAQDSFARSDELARQRLAVDPLELAELLAERGGRMDEVRAMVPSLHNFVKAYRGPTSWEADGWHRLASVCEKVGELQMAHEAYQEAVRRLHTYKEAMDGLGRLTRRPDKPR